MVASNVVSDEAAAVSSTVPPLITAAGSTKLKSSVWADFEYKAGEGGAAATAKCRWCNKTLCAGGTNGTNHLHRHSKKHCPARAEERRRQPTTAEAGPFSLEYQELEEALYVVDGLNIPQLFDELDANGLVHIDPASSDAHSWPNLPQAANSSSRRFFQKRRERKRTATRKRCVPDGFISHDQLSAQRDFSLEENKMLANSALHCETGTASGDYSCGNEK